VSPSSNIFNQGRRHEAVAAMVLLSGFRLAALPLRFFIPVRFAFIVSHLPSAMQNSAGLEHAPGRHQFPGNPGDAF